MIVKVPLRLSLLGGGTDLPSHYKRYDALLVSVTINKYIYVNVVPSQSDTYSIKIQDSPIEMYDNAKDIKHDIIRAVNEYTGMLKHRIYTYSDLPGGTGLGSSGALTVALLYTIYGPHDRGRLAEASYYIEREMLKQPVGFQDQYMAVYGGCLRLTRHKEANYTLVERIPQEIVDQLQTKLYLFNTRTTRNASDILRHQDTNHSRIEDIMSVLHLHAEYQNNLLYTGQLDSFGESMDKHWYLKRQITPLMSTIDIDNAYSHVMDEKAALGGKLVGAGGGGFLLFYSNTPDKLKIIMNMHGFPHVPFKFTKLGVREVKS